MSKRKVNLKKLLPLFMTLTLLILTTGCMHQEATYTLNSDGSGKITIVSTMAESYLESESESTEYTTSNPFLDLKDKSVTYKISETAIEETINGEKYIGSKNEIEMDNIKEFFDKEGEGSVRIIDLDNGNKRMEVKASQDETTGLTSESPSTTEQTPEEIAQSYQMLRMANIKMILNIQTDYQVVNSNAESVNNGIYTWDVLSMAEKSALNGEKEFVCFIEYKPIPDTGEPPKIDQKVTAVSTQSEVLVNGKIVAFEAYNINGNNYFKLRDIAYALTGTEKQFNVEWNQLMHRIDLVSNKGYVIIGGEMVKGNGINKFATLNASPVFKDGLQASLQAYNINGNNYFKLRDLGAVFNFGVAWDDTSNTIAIDTTLAYTPE